MQLEACVKSLAPVLWFYRRSFCETLKPVLKATHLFYDITEALFIGLKHVLKYLHLCYVFTQGLSFCGTWSLCLKSGECCMLFLIRYLVSEWSSSFMLGAVSLLVELVSIFHGDLVQTKLLDLFQLHFGFVHTHTCTRAHTHTHVHAHTQTLPCLLTHSLTHTHAHAHTSMPFVCLITRCRMPTRMHLTCMV